VTNRYAIVRQITVAAGVETCWRHVTEPALVGEWFADVQGRLAAGEPYVCDFGDGDYFAGIVQRREPPVFFQLTWQFMGVGTESLIGVHLLPTGPAETEVSVVDTGEYSTGGAGELRDGWEDFLARLKRRVETGTPSRYRWSESIGTGAIFARGVTEIAPMLLDASVWSCAFPAAQVTLDPSGGVLTLADPAWDGGSTRATLRVLPRRIGSGLSVSHDGWASLPLPPDAQLAERRRYAGLWATALARLEADLGRAQEPPILRDCRPAPRLSTA
jgi:uncharacterized protein YndB with AHSA1/START domain